MRLFSFYSDLKGRVEAELKSIDAFLVKGNANKESKTDLDEYQEQLRKRDKELTSILATAKTKIQELTDE